MGKVITASRSARTASIVVSSATLIATSACLAGAWTWGWIGFAIALVASWLLVALVVVGLYRAQRSEATPATTPSGVPATVVWPPRHPADLR